MGFKASETLLGIETKQNDGIFRVGASLQSLWNPFRDWNWAYWQESMGWIISGFKASETLLGIETQEEKIEAHPKNQASKPLKPF